MDVCSRLGVSWLAFVLGFMTIGHIAGAPEAINCDPVFITCPCGQLPTSFAGVQVPLLTCYDEERGDGKSACALCPGQTVKKVCSGYERCATCGQGLDRCLSCPQKMYGKWCDKVCDCLNDGVCNPEDGSCVCSKIFTGKKCELPVHDAVIITGTPEAINCDPVFLTCPCGQLPTSFAGVQVPLLTCYDEERGDGKSPCVLCHGQTVKNACSGYERCATCGQGLDRCLSCPQKTYGKWCDKVCDCLNDGVCNPDDGSCICSKIFTGKRCELPVHDASMENVIQHSHMVRRQSSSSTTVSCPVLHAPSNGEIHTEATAPTLNDGVKYTCHENFTMIGSSARHCLRSGQWAGEAPTCEKLCSYPVVDPHVNVAINPERLGEPHLTTFGVEILAELLFSCDLGFILIGSPRMRCASGVWDQVVPKCVHDPECADPGDPQNGERFVLRGVVKPSYKIGTQLSFNCTESDYTLVGSANITCMPFSQWSAPKPRCVPNVISDCVYECQAISASILNVAERPLVCSLESDPDTHVLLRPKAEGAGNP